MSRLPCVAPVRAHAEPVAPSRCREALRERGMTLSTMGQLRLTEHRRLQRRTPSGELSGGPSPSPREWGIQVFTRAGMLVRMNAACRAALQLSDEAQVAGRAFRDFWPPESRQLVDDAVVLAQQGTVSVFEAPMIIRPGCVRWWQVTLTPLYHDAVGSLMAMSQDLTAAITGVKARRTPCALRSG